MNMTWERLILLSISKKRPKQQFSDRSSSKSSWGGCRLLVIELVLAPWVLQNSDCFFYTLYNVVVQSSTNPFICVLISTAIFCDTVYFVWIDFRRSILNFPLFLSKFWLLLLTLKQSCIHLIFFSLFKLFLISRPVTFHEEWKHFEISCFSLFRNQWHLWSLCPVCVIVVWKF